MTVEAIRDDVLEGEERLLMERREHLCSQLGLGTKCYFFGHLAEGRRVA